MIINDKKTNSEPNNLSLILERLTPLLILATTFIWLWK